MDDNLANNLAVQLDGDARRAEASVALLLRHGRVRELLTAARAHGPGRLLALRALGDLPLSAFVEIGEGGVEHEFGDVLAPLWRSREDWIRQGGDEGLNALASQRLRFGPLL